MTTVYKLTLAAIFCLFALASCETTDCITFNTRVVIVDFLDSATENPINQEFELIKALDSEIIFYSDTSLNKLFLPVNTEVNRTTFIFFNLDASIDTLVIGYSKSERLISEDCGLDFEFSNIKIISTTFNNAISLENELSRLNEQNIKIYP